MHCSSHLKKKKIFLLTSLSSHVKKLFPNLSLSPASSSFFFLPQIFFFLSSSPDSSLVSLIPQLTGQPSSPICSADQLADPPQAPSSSIHSARRPTPSSFFSLSTTPTQASASLSYTGPSLHRPQRLRPKSFLTSLSRRSVMEFFLDRKSVV